MEMNNLTVKTKKCVDKKRIEYLIRDILEAIGEDVNREGLKDTPKRVANMYAEVFEGIQYSNEEIAVMFNKTFEEDFDFGTKHNDFVLVQGIEIFSHCEHHLILMYNMKVAIAYIPNKKIIGLSKFARIADMVSKRLQLQERIGSDIADIVQIIAETDSVAVIIKGEHGCIAARGIKKSGIQTVSTVVRGKFLENDRFYDTIINLVE